jgi:hypothetical protein
MKIVAICIVTLALAAIAAATVITTATVAFVFRWESLGFVLVYFVSCVA